VISQMTQFDTTKNSIDRLVPVSAYTEWEPLEEVVVGTLDGAVFPSWQESMMDTMPKASWEIFKARGGLAYPTSHFNAAQDELEGLVTALQREGITVVRPDGVAHGRPFSTPNWSSSAGLYAAMPRDSLMVIGEAIIEAPMSWRCRYYEADAFRGLIKAYFNRGAGWLAAPKPQLTDQLWIANREPETGAAQWAVTEFEPVFDAADFLRFGEDIIVQRSHTTNMFGIDWLRRAIGKNFRVSVIDVNDPHAMHIDATIAALAPGKMLVNPERFVDGKLFDGWEKMVAPTPALMPNWPMYFCSPWVSMNILSISPDTVIVESHELPLIETLTDWGFRCIPVDFRHVYTFGGSFHCVTLDVRRSGASAKYLNS